MRKLLFVFILLFGIPLSVMAQDGREGLLELLGTIPDQATIRETLITYADYYALTDSIDGAEIPDSWQDLSEIDTEIVDRYFFSLQGLNSGPAFVTYLYSSGEEWQATVGFDFTDIERAITFANPPETVNILIGDFDPDVIGEALTGQGYTSDDTTGDFIMWCGEFGCEDGTRSNFEKRNPANPFGGELGQQKPILVSDRVIISSASLPLLIQSEDAITDKLNSLADNDNYVTAVNSINPDTPIIQATFVHPAEILLDTAYYMMNDATDELEERLKSLQGLPQYNLVMIADTATDSEQVVYITLVYRSLDDAEQAIETIPPRLETFESLRIKRPFTYIFEERTITYSAYTVEDQETGLTAAVLEFRAPRVSFEQDAMPRLRPSMTYQLFMQMVYARDLEWLITDIPQ